MSVLATPVADVARLSNPFHAVRRTDERKEDTDMVVVLAHGEDSYRLVNSAGADIGWIRQKAVGFGGFDSEAAAIAAALEGGRALALCLKREFGIRHPALSDEPRLSKVHDGAYEWVADGKVPIARLIQTADGGRGGRFAIEFVLPSYANDAIAINAAQIIHGAFGPGVRAAATGRAAAQAAPSPR